MEPHGATSRARARTGCPIFLALLGLLVLPVPLAHKEILVLTVLIRLFLGLLALLGLLVLLVWTVTLVRLVRTARKASLVIKGLKAPQEIREQLELQGFKVTSVRKDPRAIRVMWDHKDPQVRRVQRAQQALRAIRETPEPPEPKESRDQ